MGPTLTLAAIAIGGFMVLDDVGLGVDFTNVATSRQWPFAVVLVDVAWRVPASAAAAVVVWTVGR